MKYSGKRWTNICMMGGPPTHRDWVHWLENCVIAKIVKKIGVIQNKYLFDRVGHKPIETESTGWFSSGPLPLPQWSHLKYICDFCDLQCMLWDICDIYLCMSSNTFPKDFSGNWNTPFLSYVILCNCISSAYECRAELIYYFSAPLRPTRRQHFRLSICNYFG